jgi:hypothetical protein
LLIVFLSARSAAAQDTARLELSLTPFGLGLHPVVAAQMPSVARFLPWILPTAICAALIGAVYGSTLLFAYDYHDGYLHYLSDRGAPCSDHPQWQYMLLLGRPIYTFLSCNSLHALVWTPGDAWRIRLIGIVGLILCAIYVSRMMTRRGLPALPSSIFASGFFAVPGLLVFINMTSDVANIFAIAAATAAFACLDRVRIGFRGVIPFAVAVALLLLGMLTYQQVTPLVFALVAVAVILDPEPLEARTLIGASVLAFTLAGVEFLFVQTEILRPYLEALTGAPIQVTWPESVDDMSIRIAPALALTNFAANFPRTFAVWWMNFADELWLAVFALFAICGAFFIVSAPSWRARAERLIWCILLFGAVNGLTLLTAAHDAPHRHSIPFETLIVAVIALVLYLAPRGRRVFRTAAVLFVLSGIGYSSWNVYVNLVKPSAADFAFLTESLKPYRPGDRVCFIRSFHEVMGRYRSTKVFIKNEFGRTTSMFVSDVRAYTAVAAKSLGIDLRLIGEPANLDPETATIPSDCELIIDMRTFQKQYLN